MTEACGCGLTYQAFRAVRVADYADAYHQIAWTRERTTRSAVLRHWARIKREDWAYHLDTCGLDATDGPLPEEGDASFDVASFAPAPDDGWDEWGGEPMTPPVAPECPERHESAPDAPEATPAPQKATEPALAPPRALCDRCSHGGKLRARRVRWLRNGRNAVGRGAGRSAAWLGSASVAVVPKVRGPPRAKTREPWNHGAK